VTDDGFRYAQPIEQRGCFTVTGLYLNVISGGILIGVVYASRSA
jgi:hypothetical protein